MKKSKLFLMGILGLLLVFGLVLAGCDNDGGGGDDVFTGTFISGSFSKAGGGEVKFGLKQDEKAPLGLLMNGQVVRSVSADAGNSLNGVLEDGGIAVRLTGIYDPNTGNWSVSARSDSAIYAVDGNFNLTTGESEGSVATTVEEGAGDWIPSAFWVSENPSVGIPESASATSSPSGLPSIAQGSWNCDTTEGKGSISVTLTANCLISDWKMFINGVRTQYGQSTLVNKDITILEVVKNGGSYELIYCYPEYVITLERYAEALAEYMGIDKNDIQKFYSPDQLPNGIGGTVDGYFLFDVDGDDEFNKPGAGNFDMEKMETFGATGYWKRWAARNDVEARNRYEKCKVSFPDDNTLNMIRMVTGTFGAYTYYFDSLEALNSADLAEEQDVAYGEGEGGPEYKTYVITYTRSQ